MSSFLADSVAILEIFPIGRIFKFEVSYLYFLQNIHIFAISAPQITKSSFREPLQRFVEHWPSEAETVVDFYRLIVFCQWSLSSRKKSTTQTRKYSSRMRTARFCGSKGVGCPGRVGIPTSTPKRHWTRDWKGPGTRDILPQHGIRDTHPQERTWDQGGTCHQRYPTPSTQRHGQTNACENITCPQPRWRAVKILKSELPHNYAMKVKLCNK